MKHYDYAMEKRDYSRIDKLNKLTNKDTFWDDVRKLTKRITSDHSIHRWQCLAEVRWNELSKGERYGALDMKILTKENFGNVSERSFKEIKYYLDRFKNLIEDVLDYHFEETEEALFNWLHSDTEETPMEIKNALMPTSLVNVLHVKEGWFFWYV